MRIADFLTEELINVDLKATDKDGVLDEMVEVLIKGNQLRKEDKDTALKALRAREELMSTGIGHGVAIPHAKIDVIEKIVTAFGCSKQGVDFKALDGEPVFLIFLLLASEKSTSFHIKALARISRLLKHNYIRELLKKADSPEKVLAIIKREEAKHL